MNVQQPPAPTTPRPFVLRDYLREQVHGAGQSYRDAFQGTVDGVKEGYNGLKEATGFLACVRAGSTAGLKFGRNLGRLTGVPLGIALTLTAGIPALISGAAAPFGLLGGAVLGGKVGEIAGRLCRPEDTQSDEHKKAARTGLVAGAASGAVLGFGSLALSAVGMVTAVRVAAEVAGAVVGGVGGGVIGLVTWGARKIKQAFHQPAPPPTQPPAAPVAQPPGTAAPPPDSARAPEQPPITAPAPPVQAPTQA